MIAPESIQMPSSFNLEYPNIPKANCDCWRMLLELVFEKAVASFSVLISVVHGAGCLCQLVMSVSELNNSLPVSSAVGSALSVVAMAALQSYDEPLDCWIK